MIYRIPGFFAVVLFESSAPCPSLPSVRRGRLRKRDPDDGRRVRGGEGVAKSYDGEKAWSSINLSILSANTANG
jgi:hypothetical protein